MKSSKPIKPTDSIMKYIYEMLLAALLCGVFVEMRGSGPAADDLKADELKAELGRLDATVEELDIYRTRFGRQIDSLSRQLEKGPVGSRAEAAVEISRRYRMFNADSSLYFAQRAIELSVADPSATAASRLRARLAYIDALSTLGVFSEAREAFNSLDSSTLPAELKADYWRTGRTLYSYIITYLNDDSEFSENSRRKYRMYHDSLLTVLPSGSRERRFLLGEKLVWEGRDREGLKTLSELIDPANPSLPYSAMAAFQMARLYQRQGEPEQAGWYLSFASRGDMVNSVREGLALPVLAEYLYKRKDFDNASRYLNIALDEANRGGVRWRANAIAQLIPSVDAAYRERIRSTHRDLKIYAIVATLLVLASGGLLYSLLRQRRKRRAAVRELRELTKRQTHYIGSFVSLSSSYAERLESLASIVDRKLASGQVDELRKMMKSGKYTDTGDTSFYRSMDQTILDLYPDFVERINQLLKDDSKIAWHTGDALSPEVRIYALVRLGVSESTRIAQILGYSPATVYTYRNRMRNRAVNRESFDSDIVSLYSGGSQTD